ncbi:glycoside hydrolase family 9 protein [Paenibacillus sinopodophylli]|uniref:glycoside hydrolase family 9 protein n=1 Tax=Paenibacillus sinopodophylli TaxID=1837342 RepID=UPI00110CE86E|nr:glycoside hydrolase family 9 protein [Paenibacillus sinopodophylli]
MGNGNKWVKKGSRKVLALTLAVVLLLSGVSVPEQADAAVVSKVVVSQAGYSSGDYKVAYVISDGILADQTYQVYDGATQIAAGTMVYEGITWGDHVYSINFSSTTATGTAFTLRSNGISSYTFPVQTNIWDGYKDEMTAYYRIQRSATATIDALPPGYTNTALSAKAYHAAGNLDSAKDTTGVFRDLTGGWYDAGDYGRYAGNQWVGAEIALAYVRNASSSLVRYDNDANGVPDLIDEARFGSEYLIKFANELGGAFYNIKPSSGSWLHPDKLTDNIPGTADDWVLSNLSIGGSSKGAATLAATARAINSAIAGGYITPSKVTEFQAFAADCLAAAETDYNYAVANSSGPEGSYEAIGGLANSLLFAEVELYLLTGNPAYKTSATSRIASLTFNDVRTTNYWDVRPLALAEFHPVADSATQNTIKSLLKQRMDYFLSSADDTPYGVLNEFSDFGVNEPLASYIGDAIRYYELFNDPAVLRASKKALYWIMGNNPYNKSWVSGIGTDFVKFAHTRLDEEAYLSTNTGIVFPGAMVSGPNITEPGIHTGTSPWYVDRGVAADGASQWRYNEHSISIQAGLLYSIMALTRLNTNPVGGSDPVKVPVTWPVIGDKVTGNVTIFAQPEANVSEVNYAFGGERSSYNAMTAVNGIYTATIDTSSEKAFANKRVVVRAADLSGNKSYSATHFSIAAPLPDPSTPLLYDDFGGNGSWGSQKGFNWINWYTGNGGTAGYEKITDGTRTVGKFTQTPASSSSQAKFEPWHDEIDLSGYRYLKVSVKNPGYGNSRILFQINDGTLTRDLGGGFLNVPTVYTDYSFDLNAIPGINKKKIHLVIWLKQATGVYGEMYVDDIQAVNTASGSAPVISNNAVSASSGTPGTLFTYTADYTDANNEKPYRMQVVIDGVIKDMTEVNAADTVYSDGKSYAYSTYLPAGTHVYYFRTTDTTSNEVTTSSVSGPSVSNTAGIRYESEHGTRTGGAWAAGGGSGFSGTGYAAGFNAVGDSVTSTVSVPAAGSYTLKTHYSNANGTARTMSLYVNGVKISQKSYASTGSWNVYADAANETVSLNAGSNTIKYQYDSGDVGGVNLDYIHVQ